MKHTVYCAIEIDSKTKGDASRRIGSILESLRYEDKIDQHMIFLSDKTKLKQSIPFIVDILYPFVKIKNKVEKTIDIVNDTIDTSKKIGKILIK